MAYKVMMDDFFDLPQCDKCKRAVPKNNRARTLEEYVKNKTMGLVYDRHLYPTAEGCEGSPSRVRMIETDENWRKGYEWLVA